MSDRAAQFSPFAALTGYDAAVKERARLTSEKVELDENANEHLNQQMQSLMEHLESEPVITILYFQQDEKKEGGRYEKKTGVVKKVNLYEKILVFEDKSFVAMEDIYKIEFENQPEYEWKKHHSRSFSSGKN